MSELSEYTVVVGGLEHTMLLSDEDAKRLGAKKVDAKVKAAAPTQNKARTAADK